MKTHLIQRKNDAQQCDILISYSTETQTKAFTLKHHSFPMKSHIAVTVPGSSQTNKSIRCSMAHTPVSSPDEAETRDVTICSGSVFSQFSFVSMDIAAGFRTPPIQLKAALFNRHMLTIHLTMTCVCQMWLIVTNEQRTAAKRAQKHPNAARILIFGFFVLLNERAERVRCETPEI